MSDGVRGRALPVLGAHRSPFADVVPAIVLALAFAVTALGWTIFGDLLPGGRWMAVHLFTLGVVTNVVLAFTTHFGTTLTRSPAKSTASTTVSANLAMMAVLVGMTTGQRWLVAMGGTAITAVVVWSYAQLRRARRKAVGARFGWIVRIYERAHGAFIHGAVLGMLLGLGVFRGSWYASGRLAHLHVNVLGWGGLTLLATLVFFGPTMVRTRIVDGADERASRAARHAATGLTVGVLLLFATGVGGPASSVLRLVSAGALGVYAGGVLICCLPVARAAYAAKPSATRWPLFALSLWFPAVAFTDVLVVATGGWRFLDAVGLAMILLVLAQAMTATLTYLAPMLLAQDASSRLAVAERSQRRAGFRTATYNLGAVFVVASAAIGGTAGSWLSRLGWLLILTTLGALLGVTPRLLPTRGPVEQPTPP